MVFSGGGDLTFSVLTGGGGLLGLAGTLCVCVCVCVCVFFCLYVCVICIEMAAMYG